MAQATNPTRVDGMLGDGPGGDEIWTALSSIVSTFKQRAGGPDAGARAFLLARIARSAPVRATEIADQVGLDVSTISRHLRGLEEAGLITRAPDPDDRRAALLTVTDEGCSHLAASVHARDSLLADATSDWSPTEVCDLTRLLNRLSHDLENQ